MSIAVKDDVAVLIKGIVMDARLSFKLVYGHNSSDTTNWVLSDPQNKNYHMVKKVGMNSVVFVDQPEHDSIWSFIDVF